MGQKPGHSRAVSWMRYWQPHWVKSGCELGWAPIWRLWESPLPSSFILLSEFRAFALVGLRSPFPCLCQLGPVFDPEGCPYIFSCFPRGASDRLLPSSASRLSGFSFSSTSLTLAGEISLLLRADVIRLDPLGKIQDNNFIVRSTTLIPSVESILPYTVAHSCIPEIRLWRSLEGYSPPTLF